MKKKGSSIFFLATAQHSLGRALSSWLSLATAVLLVAPSVSHADLRADVDDYLDRTGQYAENGQDKEECWVRIDRERTRVEIFGYGGWINESYMELNATLIQRTDTLSHYQSISDGADRRATLCGQTTEMMNYRRELWIDRTEQKVKIQEDLYCMKDPGFPEPETFTYECRFNHD